MTPITIEKDPKGGFTIRQRDRYADGVGFDEALGVIVSLLIDYDENIPKRFLGWMLTKEQHEDRFNRIHQAVREWNEGEEE